MNIVVSISKNLIMPLTATLLSLRKTTRENLNIYIFKLLNDNISTNDFSLLNNFLNKNDKIHIIDFKFPSNIDNIKWVWWDSHCMIRLFAPFILKEVDNFLWIDADMIFIKDISDFYHNGSKFTIYGWIEQQNNEYVKKLGLKSNYYLNSGLLLFNTKKYLNKYETVDKLMNDIINIPFQLSYPDQDILNYLFDEEKMYDSNKYLQRHVFFQKQNKNNVVYHFTWIPKPWDDKYYLYRPFLKWYKYAKLIYPADYLKTIRQKIYCNDIHKKIKIIKNKIKELFNH